MIREFFLIFALLQAKPLSVQKETENSVVFSVDDTVSYDLTIKGDTVSFSLDKKSSLSKASLKRKLPRPLTLTSIETKKNLTTLSFSLKKGFNVVAKRDKKGIILEVRKGSPSSKKTDSKEGDSKEDLKKTSNDTPPLETPDPVEVPASKVDIRILNDKPQQTDIRVSYTNPVALSSFTLQGYLFIVLHGDTKLEGAPEIAPEGKNVTPLKLLPQDDETCLVYGAPLEVGTDIQIDKTATEWWVFLRNKRPRFSDFVPKALETLIHKNADKSLRIEKKGLYSVPFTHPETSQKVFALTSFEPFQATLSPRFFPELVFPLTHQGMILLPLVKDIVVTPEKNSILITRPKGLAINSSTFNYPPKDLFDFSHWQRADVPFTDIRRTLEQEAMSVPVEDRLKSQMELAQFYAAHGLGAEILGLIRLMEETTPSLKEDSSLQALKGIGYFFNDDYFEAYSVFKDLYEYPEARLWEGALRILLGQNNFGLMLMDEAKEFLRLYPQPMRGKLALIAADAAADQQNPELSKAFLAFLPMDNLPPSQKKYVSLIEEQENQSTGTGFLKRTAEGGEARAQAETEYKAIEDDYQNKGIPLKEAIQRYENLRFAWRGDEIEYAILRKLAQLYTEQQDPRHALYSLGQALKLFPKEQTIEEVKLQAEKTLLSLMRGTNFKEVKPIKQLSVYKEFKDLLAENKDADESLVDFTKSLQEGGLGTEAAELLAGKKNLALPLASLQLKEKQYDKVLETLKTLDPENLPEKDQKEHRTLQAEALLHLGKEKEAAVALKEDESLQALRLRAQISWSAKDWKGSVDVLEKLIPLEKNPPHLIVKLAMALDHVGDKDRLKTLGETYGQIMEKSPGAATFRLLTHTATGNNTKEKLKDASNFESLLNEAKNKK